MTIITSQAAESHMKVSKHSDHIEEARIYMCEAATELDTGEYAGGMQGYYSNIMHSLSCVLAQTVARDLLCKDSLIGASSTPQVSPLLYSKGLSHHSIYKPYTTF